MILFFDTETSDLLKRRLPLDDPSQPWAVVVAAELTDEAGRHVAAIHTRVAADGRKIKAAAEAVHGVSSRAAARGGISEKAALGFLLGLADQAHTIVGHGIDFDRDVVSGVLMRMGHDPAKRWLRPGIAPVCTMRASTHLCARPREPDDGSYRWPKLDEAGEVLLGVPPRSGFHSAWDDVQRTKRIYFHLARIGALSDVAHPAEQPLDDAALIAAGLVFEE